MQARPMRLRRGLGEYGNAEAVARELGEHVRVAGIGGLWWNFALIGGGVGLCLTPMTTIAVSAVPPPRAGMASAVHNAMRQAGQVLGVAVLGALVYAHLPGGSGATTRLPAARGALFVEGLHGALWLSGLVLSAPCSLPWCRRAARPAMRG